MPRRWFLVMLVLSCHCLAACGPLTIKDTTTQSYIPIQGGILELHQDVVIPAHRTRVFFQDGRSLYGINEYYPHCELRVRDISEHTQTVHADRFSIDEVFGTVDQVVASGRIRLAAARATIIASGGGGGGNGETRLMYTYFMALHSDQQPNVSYFVCGGAFEEPALADYPTLQDVQTAMGDYATLTLDGID
ncbi:MAG: hypothetical protein U9P00_02720 [Pseudomonadota bacterium]|nr:hypothetical protein [Pseudomonadota bacterium]